MALPTYCRACGFRTPAADHPCLVEFEAARAEGATVEQALQVAKNGHERRELTAYFAKQRLKLERNIDGLHADTGRPLSTIKLAASGLTMTEVKARSQRMLDDLDKTEARALGTAKSPAQEMADEMEASK